MAELSADSQGALCGVRRHLAAGCAELVREPHGLCSRSSDDSWCCRFGSGFESFPAWKSWFGVNVWKPTQVWTLSHFTKEGPLHLADEVAGGLAGARWAGPLIGTMDAPPAKLPGLGASSLCTSQERPFAAHPGAQVRAGVLRQCLPPDILLGPGKAPALHAPDSRLQPPAHLSGLIPGPQEFICPRKQAADRKEDCVLTHSSYLKNKTLISVLRTEGMSCGGSLDTGLDPITRMHTMSEAVE